jgi:hypothetical protein
MDEPQGVQWTRVSLAVVPPNAVVTEPLLPRSMFEQPHSWLTVSLHLAASRADGRGLDAWSLVARPPAAVVNKWPSPAPPLEKGSGHQ